MRHPLRSAWKCQFRRRRRALEQSKGTKCVGYSRSDTPMHLPSESWRHFCEQVRAWSACRTRGTIANASERERATPILTITTQIFIRSARGQHCVGNRNAALEKSAKRMRYRGKYKIHSPSRYSPSERHVDVGARGRLVGTRIYGPRARPRRAR